MKCDTCEHSTYSFEVQGIEPFCNEGHWSGLGEDPEAGDQTIWDDCGDFKDKENVK